MSYEKEFDRFQYKMRARMQDGVDEYGDTSFSAEPEKLATEIQEELLDVANWAFILYRRIEALKEASEPVYHIMASNVGKSAFPAVILNSTESYVRTGLGNRVGGTTDQHDRISREYYGHDPHRVETYCVQCDAAIYADQTCSIYNDGINDLPFCSELHKIVWIEEN